MIDPLFAAPLPLYIGVWTKQGVVPKKEPFSAYLEGWVGTMGHHEPKPGLKPLVEASQVV